MPRNLWSRVSLVAVVVLGSVWYLYPPQRTINLGLDLQGGIHLVLGVETDKHIASQTDRAAEDLKATLERKGLALKRIAREGDGTLVVELANPQSWNDALTAASEQQGFERRDENQAAGRFKLVMSERVISRLRDDAVRQGLETIRNRIDQFGVAEPTITRQGSDRILIQLPGIHDAARAKALIGKTALLEFKLVDERVSVEEALKGNLPDTDAILYQRRLDKDTKSERKIPYVVQKRALLTGAELTRAEVQADSNTPGNWQVSIEFTATGARIFGEVTEANVGKHLAIILDGTVYSAPRINERIPGGLAGIALTVGMAVDTNILIFERIREELRVGKTPRAAIEAGFRRALRTIVDTHLTVMGTAVILVFFGSSSVKGFGVSLFIGLLASLFTAYFVTRLLFDLVYMGRRKVEAVSI